MVKYIVVTRNSANNCEHHECDSAEARDQVINDYISYGWSPEKMDNGNYRIIEVYQEIACEAQDRSVPLL